MFDKGRKILATFIISIVTEILFTVISKQTVYLNAILLCYNYWVLIIFIINNT